MTPEERDQVVAKYLRTPEGKRQFRRAMLHGHPNIMTAVRRYYIPRLIAQAKGWRIL